MITETEAAREAASMTLVADVDLRSIVLDKGQLIELWQWGVLNPMAFVYLALKYEGYNGEKVIDIDLFCGRWVGDEGSVKRLTRRQVVSTIAALEAKQLLQIPGGIQMNLEVF